MEITDKIKYYLRNNPFYQKRLQASINDVRFWLMGLPIYWKKYHLRRDKIVEGNTLYFIIDQSTGLSYPGLADRLKVIVCAYYLAKQNDFGFKIIFKDPFELDKYLTYTEKVNWLADFGELSYSILNSRILPFNGQSRIPKLNKKIKQYHIYKCHGKNMLECNNIPEWRVVWHDYFQEMFAPTKIVLKAYESTKLIPRNYIAVHLRFVNALENFESGHYNQISDQQKEELIQSCIKDLKHIKETNNSELVVFSDSKVFLYRVKDEGYKVLDGNVGHISFQQDENTTLKTFLDFYAISQSSKVYRIIEPHMYGTTFSYYAALAGGVECLTIQS